MERNCIREREEFRDSDTKVQVLAWKKIGLQILLSRDHGNCVCGGGRIVKCTGA